MLLRKELDVNVLEEEQLYRACIVDWR